MPVLLTRNNKTFSFVRDQDCQSRSAALAETFSKPIPALANLAFDREIGTGMLFCGSAGALVAAFGLGGCGGSVMTYTSLAGAKRPARFCG